MKSFKRNLAANFIGRGWATISTIIFVPLYIKFLGPKAYGLVGLYASLQGILVIADMGLTATLNRELARLSVSESNTRQMRDTTRTIEVVYLGILSVVIILMIALSSYFATHWLNTKGLSESTVVNAVKFMGVALILQLACSIYQGGLIGLQRQVQLNTILVVMGIVRALGVTLVLWLVAPTLSVFFIWQALSSGVQLMWIRHALWHSLGKGKEPPSYRSPILHNIWRYATGMLGMTITASILRETDKLIMSKMLPLEMLGYYTVAWSVSQLPVSVLTGPVYQATFPRLTQYASMQQKSLLSGLYHRSSQMVSVLSLPTAIILTLFPREVLYIWMGNTPTVAHAYTLLSLLAIGSGLLGIMTIPSALALANGWASLGVWINVAAITILVPILVVLIKAFGAVGGCLSWLVLNLGVLPVYMSILHRKYLIGEQWRWYFQDVGAPMAAALAFAFLFRWLMPPVASRPALLVCLLSIWVAITLAAALAAPQVRIYAVGEIQTRLHISRADKA